MTVTVKWSAAFEDSPNKGGIANNWETLLPPWAGITSNAGAAAEEICEDYFDSRTWETEFGNDEESETIMLDIHSPVEVAGRFRVDLKRVTKARATKQ